MAKRSPGAPLPTFGSKAEEREFWETHDTSPSVRFDGLELFLFSDRAGTLGGADLWASARETLSQTWSTPVNLAAMVNSAARDEDPYIAADRETLFFASNRAGGFGGLDLYVTTRTKKNQP